MAVTAAIEEALARFTTLEELKAHQESAGNLTEGLFDEPITINDELLTRLLTEPEIIAALAAYLDGYRRDADEIQFLLEKRPDGMDAEKLIESQQALAEQEATPMHRLAMRYAGQLATAEQVINSGEGIAEAETFLTRRVNIVAKELRGLSLTVNGITVEITDTRPQNREFNEKHLGRPIFGADRSDAYVASVRGGRYMLFLKAGSPRRADSCVAIMGATLDNGIECDKPTAVASALGLYKQQTGSVRLIDGNLVVDLDQPAPKE